jgi:hypothetical protein
MSNVTTWLALADVNDAPAAVSLAGKVGRSS